MNHIVTQVCMLIMLLYTAGSQAQTAGRMEYVFIDSETRGEYQGGIILQRGTLKVGQVLPCTDDAGKTYTFKVLSITDNATNAEVQSIAAGKDAYVVLQTLDKKKLSKDIVGGFNLGTKSESSSAQTKTGTEIGGTVRFTANGTTWEGRGYNSSSSYFPHGSAAQGTKEPYLLLSWKAQQTPDDRQLTMTCTNFGGQTKAARQGEVEVLLSGSESGDSTKVCMMASYKVGLGGKKPLPFTWNITKWQVQGDYALISGTFSGVLKGIAILGIKLPGCDDMEITDGTFTEVKVKVIKETYHEQQQQIGKFFESHGTQIERGVNDFLQQEVQKAKRK